MNMKHLAFFAAIILIALSISACESDQETIGAESPKTTKSKDFNPYVNIHQYERLFTHEMKIPFTEDQEKLLDTVSWDDHLQENIKLDSLGVLAIEVSPYIEFGELFIMTVDIDEPNLGRLFFPVEIGLSCVFTSAINIDHKNQQWVIKAYYPDVKNTSRETVSKCLVRYIDALQTEIKNARDGNKWTPVPEPQYSEDWQPIKLSN